MQTNKWNNPCLITSYSETFFTVKLFFLPEQKRIFLVYSRPKKTQVETQSLGSKNVLKNATKTSNCIGNIFMKAISENK